MAKNIFYLCLFFFFIVFTPSTNATRIESVSSTGTTIMDIGSWYVLKNGSYYLYCTGGSWGVTTNLPTSIDASDWDDYLFTNDGEGVITRGGKSICCWVYAGSADASTAYLSTSTPTYLGGKMQYSNGIISKSIEIHGTYIYKLFRKSTSLTATTLNSSKWTAYKVDVSNKYTITFDTNGGSPIAPITQDAGTLIIKPANPIKEGYTFAGWDKTIPSTMPSEDMKITAKWSINKYNLVYKVDGEVYKTLLVEYGATITPIAEPHKFGYSFSGWSDIPAKMPSNDLEITGFFNEILVNDIILDKNKICLPVGKSTRLSVTLLPEDAKERSVIWKSSNNSVVTVIDGLIKALCPGQATISALTTDGSNLTASSEVTAFYWGDVNLDGFVDVVDVSCIINLILNSPEIDIYDGRADANEDGVINVSDSNIIINLLLQQNLGKNKE